MEGGKQLLKPSRRPEGAWQLGLISRSFRFLFGFVFSCCSCSHSSHVFRLFFLHSFHLFHFSLVIRFVHCFLFSVSSPVSHCFPISFLFSFFHDVHVSMISILDFVFMCFQRNPRGRHWTPAAAQRSSKRRYRNALPHWRTSRRTGAHCCDMEQPARAVFGTSLAETNEKPHGRPRWTTWQEFRLSCRKLVPCLAAWSLTECPIVAGQVFRTSTDLPSCMSTASLQH